VVELATRPSTASVQRYLRSIEDERKRRDAFELLDSLRAITGWKPVMWGPSIVGFGIYGYETASGWSGKWMVTGFAPRKRDTTVYVTPGFGAHTALLAKLGKHRHSVSCLYFRWLDDVDRRVLATLVARSVAAMKRKYVCRELTASDKA